GLGLPIRASSRRSRGVGADERWLLVVARVVHGAQCADQVLEPRLERFRLHHGFRVEVVALGFVRTLPAGLLRSVPLVRSIGAFDVSALPLRVWVTSWPPFCALPGPVARQTA